MKMKAFGGMGARIMVKDFNLRYTFESAQPLTFYADYDKDLNSISYPDGKRAVNLVVEELGGKAILNAVCSDGSDAAKELRRRFRLADDMRKIYNEIGTDGNIKNAIRRYDGMRLTLNGPWETTLCFIISQFNNVKRIRLITRNIINKFGGPISGTGVRSFPGSETLALASEKDIFACGTGFRARYIASASKFCSENMDLKKLPARNYEKLKSRLMEIDGVGEKVADCIALMGYGNLRAFPIDVWVKRTMEKLYFGGQKRKEREIREFALDRWGGYAGYAQQYLFHHARTGGYD